MLCYSRETGNVKVIPWPDSDRLSRGMSAIGANSTAFRKASKGKQVCVYLSEAICAASTYEIPIQNFLEALKGIDEMEGYLVKDSWINME